MIFVFELNFHNFQKLKKLTLIRLLTTTLSPLQLIFFIGSISNKILRVSNS
jgi:hypothetical protein